MSRNDNITDSLTLLGSGRMIKNAATWSDAMHGYRYTVNFTPCRQDVKYPALHYVEFIQRRATTAPFHD